LAGVSAAIFLFASVSAGLVLLPAPEPSSPAAAEGKPASAEPAAPAVPAAAATGPSPAVPKAPGAARAAPPPPPLAKNLTYGPQGAPHPANVGALALASLTPAPAAAGSAAPATAAGAASPPQSTGPPRPQGLLVGRYLERANATARIEELARRRWPALLMAEIGPDGTPWFLVMAGVGASEADIRVLALRLAGERIRSAEVSWDP
jgi:hypothetical protein